MGTQETLPPKIQSALDQAVETLRSTLGANLYSCILYGSAVRGGLVPEVSDLNLLLILEESTPEAHAAIARAIRGPVRIEPFILGRALLARSAQAFAVKFQSIRRNYRVLHGQDPLAGLEVDERLARFLCEQAVRNLRLRSVRSFVVFGDDRKRYSAFLTRSTGALFTNLSEALRKGRLAVPPRWEDRVEVLGRAFQADASVLRDLLELKRSARTLSATEARDYHSRLFRLLDRAVRWMEAAWPPLM